jgi:hypothetical protein
LPGGYGGSVEAVRGGPPRTASADRRRMPFMEWCAPNPNGLHLRTISRYIDCLTVQNACNQNRFHAAQTSTRTPRCIIQDLKRSLASIQLRILRLRCEAMSVIRSYDDLWERYRLLTSIPGVAQISAIQLIEELSTLSPGLTASEWIAHSGLDPKHKVSGTSIRKQSRISRAGNRHLRRAIYTPALVGSRCDPYMRAFYEALSPPQSQASGPGAVARKLLHAIYGMLKTKTPYNGGTLFPILLLSIPPDKSPPRKSLPR